MYETFRLYYNRLGRFLFYSSLYIVLSIINTFLSLLMANSAVWLQCAAIALKPKKLKKKKNYSLFSIKLTLWYFARIWLHVLRNLHATAFLSVYGQGSGSIHRSTRRPKIASLRNSRYGKENMLDDFRLVLLLNGDLSGTVVKALCYKSQGRWFDSRWCHWNFSLT